MPEVITQPRKLEFGIIDIAAHPHPERCYEKLFKVATKQKMIFKIYGNEFGQLSRLRWDKDKKGNVIGIGGDIYRFTRIDPDSTWFDREKGEEADEQDINKVHIPKSLSPNTKIIHWYFVVENHLLTFICKNGKTVLSTKQAEAFFKALFNNAVNDVAKIDYVDVNTCKSPDAAERIFKKKTVSSLEIDLRRPNLDDPSGAFRKISETMKRENSKRWTETLSANDNQSLIKSDRIDELLSASNRLGSAKAITYDENSNREEIDTKEHPQIEIKKYDPETKVPILTFLTGIAIGIAASMIKSKK